MDGEIDGCESVTEWQSHSFFWYKDESVPQQLRVAWPSVNKPPQYKHCVSRRTRLHTHTHAVHAHLTGPKHYISELYSWQECITMERISFLCNDIIENPLGSFLLSNSLSLSVSPLTQTLFLMCLSRHNTIWSHTAGVTVEYWNATGERETPLCDRDREETAGVRRRESVFVSP